jgi:hypothetical protein
MTFGRRVPGPRRSSRNTDLAQENEMKPRYLLLSSVILTLASGTALAQTSAEQDGLVNVNIQDVLQDIAVDLNIEETNIPVNLQVPISVAANVCGVDVNVLSAQAADGDASCNATTGSQELTQVVQQQMAAGGNAGTDDTASGGSGGSGTTDDTASGGGSTTDDTASGGSDQSGSDDVATDGDGETDDTTTSSTKSAREFAPGQQEQPANEVAPGKQEDPKAAAPGQVKKMEEEDGDSSN